VHKPERTTVTTDTTETIGCDLGDRETVTCAVSAKGKVTHRGEVRTDRESITRWFQSRPKAHVVMEVGTHSAWISGVAKAAGHRVTVINPHQFKLISDSRKKSDMQDAELLARAARADLELLRPVSHRREDTRVDLTLLRTRDLLVRERTKLVNHVRGTLKSFGVKPGKCTPEAFHKRVAPFVPEPLKLALEPVLNHLARLDETLKQLDESIEKTAKKHTKAMALLMSVPRVGTLTALAFCLVVENPRRFKKSRDLGAYVGLAPGRRQSGDSDVQLGISKAGDGLLRRLLVQCAHQLMFKNAPDSALKRWGTSKAKSGGKNGTKKTAVALARKLAVLLHRLWVTGKAYEPFPEGTMH
jgi:transposase